MTTIAFALTLLCAGSITGCVQMAASTAPNTIPAPTSEQEAARQRALTAANAKGAANQHGYSGPTYHLAKTSK